jgi:hypothetical protein
VRNATGDARPDSSSAGFKDPESASVFVELKGQVVSEGPFVVPLHESKVVLARDLVTRTHEAKVHKGVVATDWEAKRDTGQLRFVLGPWLHRVASSN